MAKPEKRWQLLLVADDGRIIPFQRIKGIALMLLILLVLLGLVCAGLGWQLNKEKIRYRQTLDQLASVKKEATHYKSENEFITAELILAEARMGKAGLPIPKREVQTAQKTPEPMAAEAPLIAEKFVENQRAVPASEKKFPPVQAKQASTEPPQSVDPRAASADATPVNRPVTADSPVVDLGELELKRDPSKGMITASFRLNNTGPGSSSVAGRCLVVLKNDQADSRMWTGMPDGVLVDGKLDAKKGKNFKISKFIDMDMAAVATDSMAFNIATVYVFNAAGTILLEKDFPISLPAFPSDPEPAALTAEQSVAESSVGGGEEELAVALDNFEMEHDTQKNILRATFRISNTGPRSSPVAGRCVVVLKNDQIAPNAWFDMPDGAMVNGKVDEGQGQPFRISRFKDMEIETSVAGDPSVFNRAAVYVFGADGTLILEKSYPIRLPALVSKSEPAAVTPPAGAPAADDTAAPPTDDDPSAVENRAPAEAADGHSRF